MFNCFLRTSLSVNDDKMSQHLKYLQSLQTISKNIQTLLTVPKKSFCERKHFKIIDNVKINKHEAPKKEPESLLFKYDEEECIVTEREKEATVTSRLSKECDRLSSNKLVLRLADGFKLALDDAHTVSVQRSLSQPLDTTISKLKDDASEPPSDGPPPPKDPSSKRTALVRQEAGEVVFGFIPKEWVTYFYPKTGVCGFYTFLFTSGTYLVSKEIYVLEHNYYGGLSMAIIIWAMVHSVGPSMSKWLDQEIADYENSWKKFRDTSVQHLKDGLAHEKLLQFQADGQLLLIDAKRENVALQYEAEFRNRQMHVYQEVHRILNYQVAVGGILRKIQQKNLVQYVEAEVRKAVSPEMQSKLIDGSIEILVSELNKSSAVKNQEEIKETVDKMKDDKDDTDKK